MRVLIYTHTFWPSIGGIEDVGHALATGLTDEGHDVTVVTPTMTEFERPANYKIVRKPAWHKLIRLIFAHDLIHANGSTMRLMPISLLCGKPFTWTHHGYQSICIDGAGWAAGRPAPLKPWPSFLHHLKLFGFLSAFYGLLKLYLRRIGAHLVAANVQSSNYLAAIMKLPRQRVIVNPVDLKFFAAQSNKTAEHQLAHASTTFTYIGRLISEKGVDDLIYALAILCEREKTSGTKCATTECTTLKIIGDGPEKMDLQRLAQQLEVDSQITWENTKIGSDLKRSLSGAGICVIPSAWAEPSALMTMILMAAGKPLIVSRTGWLSECAGDACLTFANRDRSELAEVMLKLKDDPHLQADLIRRGLMRTKNYQMERSVAAYINLFRETVSGAAKG